MRDRLDVAALTTADLPDDAAPVSLYLLGGLRLLPATARGGLAESAASTLEGRHHVQAVLALAGSAPNGIGRDELVDVLWPNSSASAGRNRLYHSVHLARQALSAASWDDEWLVVRNGRVMLDERVWCDVLALARAAQHPAADLRNEELHALLRLCDGDWMPEMDVGPLGDSVRASVRRTQARVLREAVQRVRGQGDSPALRAHLHGLLRIEPTDEPSHRELMLLDLHAGRWHAVLRGFEVLNRELNVQLGLRPTADTSAIAAAAAAQLQQRSYQTVREPGAAPLVGREPLIQDLVQQMTQAAGVWNLTGLSGVGKTSVVREVARRLSPTLPEGVVIVGLGDLAEHDSATAACVRALGFAPSQPSEELALLAQAMQVRQMLLVLDDLDTAGDAPQLLAALPQSLSARVIVVSRARMDIAAGVHVPVPPLEMPAMGASLEQATHSASFALFVMRCAITGPELQSAAWQRDVVRLVNHLDGLPLAIELAAARAATLTPSEILHQIERNLRPLDDGPLDLVSRHRSVQSSLDWSVRLLGEAARAAYLLASVFPGAFKRADLAALAAVLNLAKSHVNPALEELVAAGLLATVAGTEQLRMLHLPRSHARALAAEQGRWQPIVQAHLHEVCRRLGDSLLDTESPLYVTQLRLVLELEDEAMALLEHARANQPALFLRLVLPLCECWNTRGLTSVVQHWADEGVRVSQNLHDADSELRFRTMQTIALRRAGRLIDAERVSQQLAALIARVANPVLVARAVSAWARALETTGQSQRAVALCEETITRLGLQPADAGFWTAYEPMLSMYAALPGVSFDLESLRGRFMGSVLWMNLLDTAFVVDAQSGDVKRLFAIAEEIVSSSQALRQHRFWLVGLWHLALCHLAMDQTAEALRKYQKFFEIARDIGWYRGALQAMQMKADLLLHEEQLDEAQACYATALATLQQASSEAGTVLLRLLHVRLLVEGQCTPQATQEYAAVPPEWLERLNDTHLADWAETAALLAGALRQPSVAHELAMALRRFNATDDDLPAYSRYRDKRFGPGPGPHRPKLSAEQMHELRTQLRGALLRFHQSLVLHSVA